jgi:hypothetical protein
MKERRIKNLKNNVYGIISSLNLFCQCNWYFSLINS